MEAQGLTTDTRPSGRAPDGQAEACTTNAQSREWYERKRAELLDAMFDFEFTELALRSGRQLIRDTVGCYRLRCVYPESQLFAAMIRGFKHKLWEWLDQIVETRMATVTIEGPRKGRHVLRVEINPLPATWNAKCLRLARLSAERREFIRRLVGMHAELDPDAPREDFDRFRVASDRWLVLGPEKSLNEALAEVDMSLEQPSAQLSSQRDEGYPLEVVPTSRSGLAPEEQAKAWTTSEAGPCRPAGVVGTPTADGHESSGCTSDSGGTRPASSAGAAEAGTAGGSDKVSAPPVCAPEDVVPPEVAQALERWREKIHLTQPSPPAEREAGTEKVPGETKKVPEPGTEKVPEDSTNTRASVPISVSIKGSTEVSIPISVPVATGKEPTLPSPSGLENGTIVRRNELFLQLDEAFSGKIEIGGRKFVIRGPYPNEMMRPTPGIRGFLPMWWALATHAALDLEVSLAELRNEVREGTDIESVPRWLTGAMRQKLGERWKKIFRRRGRAPKQTGGE